MCTHCTLREQARDEQVILYLMKKDGLVFAVQLTCCNFALVMALKVLLLLTGLLVLLGIGLSLMCRHNFENYRTLTSIILEL